MPIRNQTRGKELAIQMIIADTAFKRMRGLLGRDAMDTSEAMIIKPCQSVHMLFMRFAIDVIFLDGQGQVIGLCLCLKPYQFSPIFWKSSCAIELPAGTIARTNTQLGDLISV